MQFFRNDHKLTPSWDLVPISFNLGKENIWPIFYLSFLPRLISVVGIVLVGVYDPNQSFTLDEKSIIGLALAVFGSAWSLLAYPGLIKMQLEAVAGKQPDAWLCFKKGLSKVIPFVIMALLAALAIFFGLLFFIIPGLILIRGLTLSAYYLIDKNLGPTDALKQSFAESKHHAGYIWGTIGVGIVFSMLSSSVGRIPVAGYIFAILVAMIYLFGPALRYKEIQAAEASQPRPVQT